jgi:hypothetical protein
MEEVKGRQTTSSSSPSLIGAHLALHDPPHD